MEIVKKIVFKINDEQVYIIKTDDINASDIEDLKNAIASHYNLENKDDVFFEVIEELDLDLSQTAMVCPKGRLHSRLNSNIFFMPVDSVVPTVYVKSEAGFQKFLDLIFNNDIDGAITFQ